MPGATMQLTGFSITHYSYQNVRIITSSDFANRVNFNRVGFSMYLSSRKASGPQLRQEEFVCDK